MLSYRRLYSEILRYGLMTVWIGRGLSWLVFGSNALMNSISMILAATQIGLGLLLLSTEWISNVTLIQIWVMTVFMIILTVFFPDYWLDLSMPLVRNVPVLAATIALRRLSR